MAITKKRKAEGLRADDEVVLKYRRFETKTMKYFVDALYFCNDEQIPLAELLKLLQLTSKMENFECTTKARLTFLNIIVLGRMTLEWDINENLICGTCSALVRSSRICLAVLSSKWRMQRRKSTSHS